MQRLLVLLLVSTSALAEDYTTFNELYASNGEGGYIALTTDKCSDESTPSFPHKAYMINADGSKESGCWMRPSMEGAPKNAFEIVNIIHNGSIEHIPASLFTPNKPEVKGAL